jgi:hypothetical protein
MLLSFVCASAVPRGVSAANGRLSATRDARVAGRRGGVHVAVWRLNARAQASFGRFKITVCVA